MGFVQGQSLPWGKGYPCQWLMIEARTKSCFFSSLHHPGNESWSCTGYSYSFLFSFFPPGAGILAMANAGPDTNGSQFFVTLAPTQWLDGKHTIFGRVCQGIGMVNRVGMVETNSQDRPVDDVKIIKAYPSG